MIPSTESLFAKTLLFKIYFSNAKLREPISEATQAIKFKKKPLKCTSERMGLYSDRYGIYVIESNFNHVAILLTDIPFNSFPQTPAPMRTRIP